ncbi:hypothetical protein [uncultured Porphyromonas sp.]|jgi:lipoprotein|uniref:hypothetical protein n=1 Tax=uncultured Porphyromonas sp. TaxID=159274 RepID=UPI0026142D86|nr:hypothetical protein [uncultured Porphyromonas sp.]
MKSQIRLGLCLALGLSLFSCNSQGDPIEPNTPPVPEERLAFTLNLEAEGTIPELRDFDLDFEVGAKGALKVDIKKGEKYEARCFLRKEGEEQCYYGSVKFTGKENGKLEVLRGANSEVDFFTQSQHKGGNAEENKYGFTKGEKWYLLVVFGGEHLGGSGTNNSRIRFSNELKSGGGKTLPRIEEGKKIKLKDIPYVSDWTPLSIWQEGGNATGIAQALSPLTFKPVGTLLRIRVRNNLAHASVQVRGFGFDLNGVSSSVTFSLPGTGNTKPSYTSERTGTRSVSLPQSPEIQPKGNDNGYYLLWVYPDQETGGTFKPNNWSVRDMATVSATPGKTSASMPSNTPAKELKRGASYMFTVTVDRPQMILELLDEYNYEGVAPKLATNHSNLGRQMYTYAAAQSIASSRAGYHLPNQLEWQMIIGHLNASLPNPLGLSISTKDEPLRGIFHTTAKGKVQADYYRGPLNSNNETNIFYGLRFKGLDEYQSTSAHLSAFRYEVKQNPSDPTGYIYCIRSRYLGPSSTLKIADIAKEEWWNTPDAEEVVRYLPFAGGYFPGVYDEGTNTWLVQAQKDINNPYRVGNWGTYWTSTLGTKSSAKAAGTEYRVIAGAKYYTDYKDWVNKKKGYNAGILAPTFSGNLGSVPEDGHASVRLIKDYQNYQQND